MFTAGPAGGAGQRVALGLGVPVGDPGLADLIVDGVNDGLHSVAAPALRAAGIGVSGWPPARQWALSQDLTLR